ncbi:E3 ubiquitin-protein ligase RING1-like [Cardamine amara subsp. amara]|uniref:E3 ubiquitin-protein ligase RING1-like n=1 Tax=Cardamine amara subsp. amara TaxID=228776 RepID=A0ABD1AUC1_CARAN
MMSSFTHEIVHNPEPEDVDTIKITVYLTKIYKSIELLDLCDELIESSSVPVSLRENIYVELTEFLTESGAITYIDGYDALLSDLSRFADEVTSSDDYTPDCALRVRMSLTVFYLYSQTDQEEVLDLLDESDDIIFDFDHRTEEAAPSQNIEEVLRVSLNETIQEEDLGVEDEQFSLDHQIEEAIRSQIEEVFRISFNETNTVGLRPASKLAVCSLSRKIYNKTSDTVGEIDITCSICLEEFENGRRIVTLPCGHDFDDGCIVEWFVSSHVCPLCRFELPSEDEE